jgi:hypothetical protein
MGDTPTPESTPFDIDKFTRDFDARELANPTTETPEADAAPPAATAPADPVTPAPADTPSTEATLEEDWFDKGLPANHGFLKGKTGPEIEKAFRSAEGKIREYAERHKQTTAELEQLRREREADAALARREKQQTAAPAPQATDDEDPRMKQVRELWYVDETRASALMREIMLDDAKKIAADTLTTYQSEREFEQHTEAAKSASNAAVDELATTYGLPRAVVAASIKETWPMFAAAVKNGSSMGIWGVKQNYIDAFTHQFGPPPVAPGGVPPAAAAAPDPPGSKHPAAAPQSRTLPRVVDPAMAADRRQTAKELGLSPTETERYVAGAVRA